MKFVVYPCRFKGRAGYRWRLVGGNSEKVAYGEFYVRKYNALRAVARIKAEAADATVEVKK